MVCYFSSFSQSDAVSDVPVVTSEDGDSNSPLLKKSGGKALYVCSHAQCGKSFKTRNKLKSHRRGHSDNDVINYMHSYRNAQSRNNLDARAATYRSTFPSTPAVQGMAEDCPADVNVAVMLVASAPSSRGDDADSDTSFPDCGVSNHILIFHCLIAGHMSYTIDTTMKQRLTAVYVRVVFVYDRAKMWL